VEYYTRLFVLKKENMITFMGNKMLLRGEWRNEKMQIFKLFLIYSE